jgi:hypothetical protein
MCLKNHPQKLVLSPPFGKSKHQKSEIKNLKSKIKTSPMVGGAQIILKKRNDKEIY